MFNRRKHDGSRQKANANQARNREEKRRIRRGGVNNKGRSGLTDKKEKAHRRNCISPSPSCLANQKRPSSLLIFCRQRRYRSLSFIELNEKNCSICNLRSPTHRQILISKFLAKQVFESVQIPPIHHSLFH